jgi:hypothetical protein
MNDGLIRVFKWPAVIAVLSAGGLVAALVADGVWDLLFCALLAVPVATGMWFSLACRESGSATRGALPSRSRADHG